MIGTPGWFFDYLDARRDECLSMLAVLEAQGEELKEMRAMLDAAQARLDAATPPEERERIRVTAAMYAAAGRKKR